MEKEELLSKENVKKVAEQININDLNDAQIEEIISTAKDIISPDSELVRNINQSESTDKKELVEGQSYVTVDPITGEKQFRPYTEAPQYKDTSLEELVDESEKAIYQVTDDMKISDEDKELYNLSDEDAAAILSIIQRRKNKEKFSVYGAMTESLQKTVRNMAQTNDIKELGSAAKILIDQFASNLLMDKEYIDFQQALSSEVDKLNFANIYGDQLKERMTVTLESDAKKLEEKYPEKAKSFRKIREQFIHAYSFDIQFNALVNDDKVARRLDKDLKHFERMCTNFNYKYKYSKMVIKDISLASQVLSRILPNDYTADDIKKFFILFMRICLNMSPDNISEHVFMYYTILLIVDLDYMNDKSEFRKEILSNIEQVLCMIQTRCEGEKNKK